MSRSSAWGTRSVARISVGSATPPTTSSTGAPAASPTSAGSTSPSSRPLRPCPGSSSTEPSDQPGRGTTSPSETSPPGGGAGEAPAGSGTPTAIPLLLGLFVVVGLLARVWSVSYGLPDLYHPDEPRIVERAVRFHAGDLNPHFFNWPSLYMYLLSGV